jgi:hypothetical protein
LRNIYLEKKHSFRCYEQTPTIHKPSRAGYRETRTPPPLRRMLALKGSGWTAQPQ